MWTNQSSKRAARAWVAATAVIVTASPSASFAQSEAAPAASASGIDQAAQPSSERTEASSPTAGPQPRLHHAPRTVTPAGEVFVVKAEIVQPQLVRQAWLIYRASPSEPIQELPFRRASTGPYVAVVPAAQVKAPQLLYSVEVETLDGQRRPVFASRASMFPVSVPPDYDDLREQALLTRLEGKRSEVTASGEYVLFGTTDATLTDPDSGATYVEGIQDRYYRLESGYTYRPLGTVAEFSIRLGVVRGRSVVPDESDASEFDVGLNYASPRVRFRINESFHVETELLTSVTEVGFSLGAGGAVLIGDPYGSRLTFGFESVQTFGTRLYTRMDIPASDRVSVAPVIEVTDMPHADRYGVRLLSEVGVDAGAGFRLSARGGYQARTFTSGGPSVGASMAYAF